MKKTVVFGTLPIKMFSDDERYSLTELPGSSDEVLTLELKAEFSEPVRPASIDLTFETDMLDLFSTWRPCGMRDHGIHQWFAPTHQTSSFYCGSPLFSCTDYRGGNCLTAAVSDSVNPVDMSVWVDDLAQREEMGYRIRFFGSETCDMTSYHAEIRIDRRKTSFSEAVRDAAKWQNQFADRHDAVPAAAEMPLYSTWYNFHQQPDQKMLERDLAEAAALGLKTLIVDDGWQFDGQGDGNYRLCGDWTVSKAKFPDFRRFTDLAHHYGIKVVLWFAAPFIGYDTEAFERFKGKYLYLSDHFHAGIVDIRRPEVREFIISTYERFIREYGLDGIKLDFVDSFMLTPESPVYDPEAMDCVTVNDAARMLLDGIVERCNALKPDFLLEFRQNYVGPAIVSYGNMLRVGDCAFDAVTNRIGMADLRLLSENTAVHSDMLYWGKKESPENVARQLCNILFAVPQISVILAEAPEAHKKVLNAYLAYWMENRQTLLHGTFSAYHPEANYSRIEAEDDGKRIDALYSENLIVFDGKPTDVFAASGERELIIDGRSGDEYRVTVYDCFGKKAAEYEGKGLLYAELPTAPAFCRIEKKSISIK